MATDLDSLIAGEACTALAKISNGYDETGSEAECLMTAWAGGKESAGYHAAQRVVEKATEWASDRARIVAFLQREARRFEAAREEAAREFEETDSHAAMTHADRLKTKAGMLRTIIAQVTRGDDRLAD